MGMRLLSHERRRIRNGSRQRTSEATSQARCAVENTAAGRCSAEEPSIGAPPGSRCTFHVGVWGFGSRTRLRAALGRQGESRDDCGDAEAGGSPSSEASPGWLIWRADGKVPRPRRRAAHAQDESALEGAQTQPTRKRRCAGVAPGATGNRAVRRVLVTGVGCRSR